MQLLNLPLAMLRIQFLNDTSKVPRIISNEFYTSCLVKESGVAKGNMELSGISAWWDATRLRQVSTLDHINLTQVLSNLNMKVGPFYLNWYKLFPDWLEYTPTKHCAYCFLCYLFKSLLTALLLVLSFPWDFLHGIESIARIVLS